MRQGWCLHLPTIQYNRSLEDATTAKGVGRRPPIQKPADKCEVYLVNVRAADKVYEE
jgi:hypothetical protein